MTVPSALTPKAFSLHGSLEQAHLAAPRPVSWPLLVSMSELALKRSQALVTTGSPASGLCVTCPSLSPFPPLW